MSEKWRGAPDLWRESRGGWGEKDRGGKVVDINGSSGTRERNQAVEARGSGECKVRRGHTMV